MSRRFATRSRAIRANRFAKKTMSEGRGCLEERMSGTSRRFPRHFWSGKFWKCNFPRKWRKRRQEPELPDLPWKSPTAVSQTSATTRQYFRNVRAIHANRLKPAIRNSQFPKGPKIEKIQDRPPGLNFSIEIENFKRATHQTPIFCGEFWRSGLKISIKIEIFNRDWIFQSRLNFFNLWALRVPQNAIRSQGGSCSSGTLKRFAGIGSSTRRPFRTKNAIAVKIVVFCYHRSACLTILTDSLALSPSNNSIRITIAVVNYYRSSELLSP